jgi:Flp pilus assembly protein TadG
MPFTWQHRFICGEAIPEEPMHIPTSIPRRGATFVEVAFIQPVCFTLLFGILFGGILIFNYQQVAWLSREASRRASVRGDQYAQVTGKTSPTQADILQTVVLPLATTMDPSQLTLEVFLIDGSTGAATSWDSSNKAVSAVQSDGSKVANRVRVRVTYVWGSTIFTGAPITLQSTSEVPMSF